MVAGSLQQRGEKRVLVFAVTVLVMQHVGRGMRLIAAHPKRETDVAEVRRHIVVEGLNFVQIRGLAGGERSSFGANFCRGLTTVFLQPCVPAPHLLPACERRHLDSW